MKQLPLLSVPLKETTQFSWTSGLKEYLTANYGSYKEFSNEVEEFDKLRLEMVGCNQDSVGIGFYIRYYSELELLEMRVNGGIKSVEFTWYDAFTKSTKISQHAIAFEKACVLFNLASLLSVVANNQYSNHDDETNVTENYKNSLINYQNASGVYQFIAENFLHAPSNDLNQTTIKFLSKLMLAQAQEIFTLNLIINQESDKYSLLSKLCQSTANFYKSSHDLISSLVKDSTWYSDYYNWNNIVNVKSHYYDGLANYYQSLVLLKAGKYGESIGYIKNAIDIFTELKGLPLASFSSSNELKINYNELIKVQNVKPLIEKLNKELVSLEKDNDYIYHNQVVQKFNLGPIKGMDAVKPSKLDSIFNSTSYKLKPAKNLFKNLVPIKVVELNSIYVEEKAKKVRGVEAKIENSEINISSFNDYLSLPTSIIKLKDVLFNENDGFSGDPDLEFKEFYKSKLKPLSERIKTFPRIDFQAFKSQGQEVLSLIQDCDQLLKSDEDTYNNYLNQFKSSWTQDSPNVSSMPFKNDLIKTKRNLLDTENSDQQLFKQYKSIEKLYGMLLNPSVFKSQLRDYFQNKHDIKQEQQPPSVSLLDLDDTLSTDNVNTNDLNESKILLETINNNLRSLTSLSKELKLLLNEFKQKVHEDDISDLLVINKNLTQEQFTQELFPQQLEKFDPYESRTDRIISKLDSLMTIIKSDYSKILSNPAVKQKQTLISEKRGEMYLMYEKIQNFEKVFDNIILGINNGNQFYSNMQNYVINLQTSIKNYLTSRLEESKRLSSSLTNNHSDDLNERLSKLNLAASSSLSPTVTNNNNIYSNDISNQNRYSSVSSTSWNQSPLIPKKSGISAPESTYYGQPPPSYSAPLNNWPQQPSFNNNGSSAPPLPPKISQSQYQGFASQQYSQQQQQPVQQPSLQQQQTGIPFYNSPSNYDPNMYSMFGDHK